MNKKKKNTFANKIIAMCVIMCTIITITTLTQYWTLSVAIPSAVLGTLVGFWGGELLIVALRQIFGSDVLDKTKKKSADDNVDADDEFKI